MCMYLPLYLLGAVSKCAGTAGVKSFLALTYAGYVTLKKLLNLYNTQFHICKIVGYYIVFIIIIYHFILVCCNTVLKLNRYSTNSIINN